MEEVELHAEKADELNKLVSRSFVPINSDNLEERLDGPSRPYVPMSVEEVSSAKSLKHWTNTNVRVIGKVHVGQPSMLESVLETDGPYNIKLELDLLTSCPPSSTVVQVFGELTIVSDTPVIKVNFIRTLDSVDLNAYQLAIELQRKYIPFFYKSSIH